MSENFLSWKMSAALLEIFYFQQTKRIFWDLLFFPQILFVSFSSLPLIHFGFFRLAWFWLSSSSSKKKKPFLTNWFIFSGKVSCELCYILNIFFFQFPDFFLSVSPPPSSAHCTRFLHFCFISQIFIFRFPFPSFLLFLKRKPTKEPKMDFDKSDLFFILLFSLFFIFRIKKKK